MPRHKQYIWILLMIVFLSGCASFKSYPDRPVDLKEEINSLGWCFKPDVINTPASEDPTDWRNKVVNCQILTIDLEFISFEQRLSLENIELNTGVDLSVIGLGAATGVVGGATSKAILGIISGGITGSKGVIDKDIYFSKTMPALLSQMEAQRQEALVNIRNGLHWPASAYPLSEALIDVETYYRAGSIPAAVQGIINQSGAIANAATIELKNIVKLSPLTEEDVVNKQALTKTIDLLTANDIEKAQRALLVCDPEARGSTNIGDVKNRLQDCVRKARSPKQIDELTRVFKDAGILP